MKNILAATLPLFLGLSVMGQSAEKPDSNKMAELFMKAYVHYKYDIVPPNGDFVLFEDSKYRNADTSVVFQFTPIPGEFKTLLAEMDSTKVQTMFNFSSFNIRRYLADSIPHQIIAGVVQNPSDSSVKIGLITVMRPMGEVTVQIAARVPATQLERWTPVIVQSALASTYHE